VEQKSGLEHAVTEEGGSNLPGGGVWRGSNDADALVLGCTHYPLLKPLLRRVAPVACEHCGLRGVDGTGGFGAAGKNFCRWQGLRKNGGRNRVLGFFATDSVEKFRRLGQRFLGHAVDDVQHVDLKE